MSTSFWSLNSWGQDILGPFYSAATGKVDPWTKNIMIENCITETLQARGLDPSDQSNRDSIAALCETNVTSDITNAEKQPPPKPDCNNPGSDILVNLNCALKKFETGAIIIIIILIFVYLGGQYFKGRGGR